ACGGWRPRAAAREISDGALSAVVTDAQVGLVGSVRAISDEGPPGLAVVQARVPVQPHTGGWRSDLQGAMGIAPTADEARAVAVFEALERYCCVPRGRRLDCASAEELGERHLDPRQLVLHADAQYGRPGFPYRPFDPSERRTWTWARSARLDAEVAVPADVVFYRLRRLSPPGGRPVRPLAANSSSGCAIRRGAG